MIVTDKEYSLEKKYVKKLNLLAKRLKGTDDVVLPIDGSEGCGKTEIAVATCYYISQMTGREYNINHIFFKLDEVINFAQSTKEQIIHFDEGALGLLTTQWHDKVQQKFIQLIMVARKKKHFIVICIPKFHRLPQYVIEERSIGLVHVYARKNLEKGRFFYFTQEKKDRLYQDWIKKRIKNYRKHKSFRGTFPEATKKIWIEKDREEYERKKDEAIMSIGKDKKPLTTNQARWIDQRNRLIILLRKVLKVSQYELPRILKENQIEITRAQIRDIELALKT